MILQDLLVQIEDLCMSPPKAEYRMMVPITNEDGDIDEIEMVEVTSITWDIADKRLILNW